MARKVLTDIHGVVDIDRVPVGRVDDPEINWSGEAPVELRDLNEQRMYLVPVQDEQGKSERLREFKVHPNDHRALYRMLDMRVFPFRTESDILRFCLRVGLAHLRAVVEAHNPGFKTDFQILDYADEALADSIMQQRLAQLGQRVHDDVMTLLVQGHIEKAHERALIFKRAVERLNDPYWREIGEREYATHVQPLLRSRAMSLVPVKH